MFISTGAIIFILFMIWAFSSKEAGHEATKIMGLISVGAILYYVGFGILIAGVVIYGAVSSTDTSGLGLIAGIVFCGGGFIALLWYLTLSPTERAISGLLEQLKFDGAEVERSSSGDWNINCSEGTFTITSNGACVRHPLLLNDGKIESYAKSKEELYNIIIPLMRRYHPSVNSSYDEVIKETAEEDIRSKKNSKWNIGVFFVTATIFVTCVVLQGMGY